MQRAAPIFGGVVVLIAIAFASGVVGHDRIASLWPAPLPFAENPPRWMLDYAKAFCGADTTTVASRIDVSLASEDDVKQAFAARDWTCSDVRYLGSSSGKGGTAYIFLLHDGKTGLDNWWVFTVSATQKIVRID